MITGRAATRGHKGVLPPSANILRTVQLPAQALDYTGVTWRAGQIVSLNADRRFRHHDATTGAETSSVAQNGTTNEIVATPDGAGIAMTQLGQNRVALFPALPDTNYQEIAFTSPYGVSFMDGDLLLSTYGTGKVTRLSGVSAVVKDITTFPAAIDSMVWTGRHFITSTASTIRVFDGFSPAKLIRSFSIANMGLGWDGSNLMSITAAGLVRFHRNEAA